MTKKRPGGRSARTRASVFCAAAALLAEKRPIEITMAEIADRAGVAPTSLYRRWGDVSTLLLELVIDRLVEDAPLPDTGSLRGDLTDWILQIARGLQSRDGSTFFRVLLAMGSHGENSDRMGIISRRLDQVKAMLERARARHEPTPSTAEIADHILAPLYMRALFGAPVDESHAQQFIERVLSHAAESM